MRTGRPTPHAPARSTHFEPHVTMATPSASSPHPSGDNRFKLLDRAITKHQSKGDALIEVLHAAQGIFGYLENDLLLYVARKLKLPLSRVYGVARW
ncbi:MAG: dehydrogenase chain [candidate division NC10 bacterium]|nr:dehydrogenase chain [candidate division NC10 bacterium]